MTAVEQVFQKPGRCPGPVRKRASQSSLTAARNMGAEVFTGPSHCWAPSLSAELNRASRTPEAQPVSAQQGEFEREAVVGVGQTLSSSFIKLRSL